MEGGESPDEAARAAQRAFGNTAQIQEDVRESWGWAGVERFGDDIRIGLRMLRKTPLWTAVICATLALGVGLSTAIFSVVYGVLLQPLPYPNPDRLVALVAVGGQERLCPLQRQRRALARLAEELDASRRHRPYPADR